MGVKIAAAMGAEVTTLTRSDAERADAAALGAAHFYATAEPTVLKPLRGSFDLTISTFSAGVKVETYLALLRLSGTLVNVGVSPEPCSVCFGSLAGNRRRLSASGFGGNRETQEMLDFCAANGKGANIEVIGASQIHDAQEQVVHSDVRYRFAIDTSAF
jgi:uncharacterized zinc-type alcohol dehydrogenase-like protein